MGLTLKYDKGQTPLDDDELEGLLIKSIITRGELDEFEQLNIEKAIEWTLKRKRNISEILTVDYIKLLHKKMYGDVWQWAGTFRKTNKNIGVDKFLIGIELKKLLDDFKLIVENNVYAPGEIAIRFKHRLVSIHCFPNGNGRHSRLMADVIITHVFGKEYFTWKMDDLNKNTDQRTEYIAALRKSRRWKYSAFVEICTNISLK